MKLEDKAQAVASKFAGRLRAIFSGHKQVSEEQAEAASHRFEKAVFHSIYSEGAFENAIHKHREMMRVLGEAIGNTMTEYRREWQRNIQLGEHCRSAHKARAKRYFKRIILLIERIDAHLKQFERKVNLLPAGRQYKIENNIYSGVDVGEVEQFVGEEFDQFEMQETSPEIERGQRPIGRPIGSDEALVSQEEEKILEQFIERALCDNETDSESSMTDKTGAKSGPEESEYDEQNEDIKSIQWVGPEEFGGEPISEEEKEIFDQFVEEEFEDDEAGSDSSVTGDADAKSRSEESEDDEQIENGDEVRRFLRECDQFEMQETSPEVEKGKGIDTHKKGSHEDAVSQEGEEMAKKFIETVSGGNETDSELDNTKLTTDSLDQLFEAKPSDNEADSESSMTNTEDESESDKDDDVIDDEIVEWIKQELAPNEAS